MRLSVVLGAFALFLLPAQSQAAWDIFQSYVILDSGSGDQYLAGGINADGASAFAGTDLGDFTAADALTLNGGELKTYKNGIQRLRRHPQLPRLRLGRHPGRLHRPRAALQRQPQWLRPEMGRHRTSDRLARRPHCGRLRPRTLREADGGNSNPSGCGETQYDNDSGNNFTATFSILSAGACGTSVNFDVTTMKPFRLATVWFAENLRTTVYADGTAIPEVTTREHGAVKFGALLL